MFKQAFVGIVASVLFAATAFAQCNCGNCGGDQFSVGNYTTGDYLNSAQNNGECYAAEGNSCGGSCHTNCDSHGSCDTGPPCYRYLSLFGGWNGVQDFEPKDIGLDQMGVNSGGFNEGTIFGAALGRQVHPQARWELEVARRDNDVVDWTVSDFTAGELTAQTMTVATGSIEAYSGLVNLLFDLEPRRVECWNLYGGAGFGVIDVDGDIATPTENFIVNDSSFAFQGIVGVTKGVRHGLDFFAEYKYLVARDIKVNNVTTGTELSDFQLTNNSVVFGLRILR